MKNNLQGINSRVDKAKKQISNFEYKEAKQHPIRRLGKKRNKNKMKIT